MRQRFPIPFLIIILPFTGCIGRSHAPYQEIGFFFPNRMLFGFGF